MAKVAELSDHVKIDRLHRGTFHLLDDSYAYTLWGNEARRSFVFTSNKRTMGSSTHQYLMDLITEPEGLSIEDLFTLFLNTPETEYVDA